MIAPNTRSAFILFHGVLGLGLLIMSLQTLAHALHHSSPQYAHLAVLAGLEAVGAALFMIPRTLRWGGAALLVILLGGFVVHLTRREWEIPLLIYATGVWFVMGHRAAWGRSLNQ